MNRYLTIGPRIIASIVDSIVFIPFVALSYWMYQAQLPNVVYFGLVLMVMLVGNAYNVLMHWKYGQTIGKMVVKVKVLDISEGPITFGQAFLRDIFYIVHGVAMLLVNISVVFLLGHSRTSEVYLSVDQYSLIPLYILLAIEILVCIKSKKNRALHDLVAGTVVVRLEIAPETENGMNYEPPGPDLYDELNENRV